MVVGVVEEGKGMKEGCQYKHVISATQKVQRIERNSYI